jgi:glycosyltransferase involved in cell wall biosynthesis
MACGTPAIATDIGGVPEIIMAPVAGRLMRQRSPQCLSATVTELFAEYPERIAVRNYAEEFTWDATTEQQLNLFREITHS